MQVVAPLLQSVRPLKGVLLDVGWWITLTLWKEDGGRKTADGRGSQFEAGGMHNDEIPNTPRLAGRCSG